LHDPGFDASYLLLYETLPEKVRVVEMGYEVSTHAIYWHVHAEFWLLTATRMQWLRGVRAAIVFFRSGSMCPGIRNLIRDDAENCAYAVSACGPVGITSAQPAIPDTRAGAAVVIVLKTLNS